MSPSIPRGLLRRVRRLIRGEGNLLDVLLDSVDVAVVACGPDGHPTHVNRRAVELMGMDGSAGSHPDTWIEQVWPRTPEGRKLALDELPIVRALQGEVVRDVDLLVRTPHGDVLMSTTANPVCDERGARLGAVAVFADVTEQRAREARVREELRTLGLVHGVQEALAAGRLLLYAQPIIDLAAKETLLEELLLRMRSRGGAIVGPGELLAAAERHGTATAIDEWVFERATKIAASGRAVTVNVSAQTVVCSSFVEFAERALDRNGAPPSLITFEITETAVISDIVGATRFANRLEAIGCRFALDDFGTGYAALTYLKHIPFSYVKIDVDFVRDLLHNGRSRAVVSGVVALAAGLDLRTIAEGVEDEATLSLLLELGVDLAQGFHIGRPAPVVPVAAPG
ncbi:MAG TPA: EAL domain-containing protein [Solirubrobacteraceae bacterium]|jgi:EAL domain-containing protein (putative c-di-GMP-specific phosphodiesterase class I)|nr:EAL domain-containing protein [Solirubrobacteraceae bacterium]